MCCDITLICHFVKLIRMMSLSGLPVRLQSVSQSVRPGGENGKYPDLGSQPSCLHLRSGRSCCSWRLGWRGGRRRESVGQRLRIIINFADSKFYKRADINYHWEYQTGHGGFPWVLFGHILYLASYIVIIQPGEIMTELSRL